MQLLTTDNPRLYKIALSLSLVLILIFSGGQVKAQASTPAKKRAYLIEASYTRATNELEEISTSLASGYYDFGPERALTNISDKGAIFNLSLVSFTGQVLYQRQVVLPLFSYDLGYVNSTTKTIPLPYRKRGEKAVFSHPKTGKEQLEVDLTRFADPEVVRRQRPEEYRNLYTAVEVKKRLVNRKRTYKQGQEIIIRLQVENKNNFPVTGTVSNNNHLPGIKLSPSTTSYRLKLPANAAKSKQYSLQIKEVNFSGSVKAEDLEHNLEKNYQLDRATFSANSNIFYSNRPSLRISNQPSKTLPFNLPLLLVALTLLVVLACITRKYVISSQERSSKGTSLVIIMVTTGTLLVSLALLIITVSPQIGSVSRSLFGENENYQRCLQACQRLKQCQKVKRVAPTTVKDYRQECAAYYSCKLTGEVDSSSAIDPSVKGDRFVSVQCGNIFSED